MRLPRGPIAPGSVVGPRDLPTVNGDPVAVPAAGHLVHLQFRRFAGCPVCNLHLRSFVRRHNEIEAAGVREVVVFHSPVAELAPHATDLPFAVVADPERRLYDEFGVRSHRRALLSPGAWPGIVRAIVSGTWAVVRGRERLPSRTPHGGRLGLPADFLIAPDGRVLAVKYGEHANDQWPLDDVLALASSHASAGRGSPAGERI